MSQKHTDTNLVDEVGIPLEYATDGEGKKRIITNTVQQVFTSTSNNSTANLAYNTEFIGVGESSLNVAGIQVNFASDQKCLIRLQQSNDNINWDFEDSWTVNGS